LDNLKISMYVINFNPSHSLLVVRQEEATGICCTG